MSLLTQAGFAALAGTSQPAITRALQAGRIVYVEENGIRGIDPTHPLSVAYLAERHDVGRRRTKRPIEQPTGNAAGASPQATNGTGNPQADNKRTVQYSEIATSRARDTELRQRKLELEIDEKRRKRLKELNQLIPKPIVAHMCSTIGSALNETIRSLPDRIAAQLAAIAGAPETEVQLRTFLSAEIETALERWHLTVKRATAQFEQEETET